jgi:fructose-1,6-bisphosphatase/inositol monophosphatase family enzyme
MKIINKNLIKRLIEITLEASKVISDKKEIDVLYNKVSIRELVTNKDLEVNKFLIKGLKKTKIPVLSEESRAFNSIYNKKKIWVLDPIDGTVNYINNSPNFGISIGLVNNKNFTFGIVCLPAHSQLYFNTSDKKCYMNGISLTHKHKKISDSLIAVSLGNFPSDKEMLLFKNINNLSWGCLRTGSTSMNICWTAINRFQVSYGFNINIWDAAGALAIAKSSGCKVLINKKKNSNMLDFIVGSNNAVKKILKESKKLGLWKI